MARRIYLTGHPAGGGKSAIALGVMELLSRRVRRLGAFRPLVRSEPDPTLELLRCRYRLERVGAGASEAEAAALLSAGRLDELIGTVVECLREQVEGLDAALIIGTDFDSGFPDDLALNARLANELGAAVLSIVDGRGRDPEEIAGLIGTAYHSLVDLDATLLALVANRVPAAAREKVLAAVGALPVPVYAVPDVPAVSAPTVAEVTDALGGVRLLGRPESYARDVLSVVFGGATVPTLLDHLHDGALLITPGDRADLILAAHTAHLAGRAALAGVVLTLGLRPDPRVVELVTHLGGELPVAVVPTDSFETMARVAGIEGQLSPDNPRKAEAALGAFESSVDTAGLTRRLDIARSARVTPLMFEYELISGARAARRHVVLPEGTEERILRAAEILLRRDVCELTLLGPQESVRRRIRELGLALTGASIVDPMASPWREDFASRYAQLRAHRGVTLENARDLVTDPNYFGTLMVASGRADAMVSGAAHPTADTIRPAFQIIKTVPGVSVASSVFFMCLPDQVLVYGDCAIVPDPTPEQLADIAISSAATAAAFGIQPLVAMLSYATGGSGHGCDVEKVAAATALVRQRAPQLPVEGPIQYDAAVDPVVAAAKLPGSRVAGRATVFIFPDLNTGNNTYKAVQRSAGAVAVGPVLQGLRRPVNDLSRGATVADIVNTVAITAIQAAAPADEAAAPAGGAVA
ncbi:MAG: phosphate acetyltransferase [Micromonosporaceae bacterium]|nr:phosphate acetyltransferase [Micromonosporaceae bacterium]